MRRRKVQDFLELSHEVDLAAAFEDIDTFLGGDYRVAVEIGPARIRLCRGAVGADLRAARRKPVRQPGTGRLGDPALPMPDGRRWRGVACNSGRLLKPADYLLLRTRALRATPLQRLHHFHERC
jgi:hypothetical protein